MSKKRDIERLAAYFRIVNLRADVFSTRQQRSRIIHLLAKLNTLPAFAIAMAAHRYNQQWIVKRRAYGTRSKIRQYWRMWDFATDERRAKIEARIAQLAKKEGRCNAIHHMPELRRDI